MISKSISVEKVKLEDNQKLLEFGRKTFYESFAPYNTLENIQMYLDASFTLKKITQELLNPKSIFYFAKLNDQIVGYLKLNFGDSQTEIFEDKTLEVERIYISKKYQGNKIGQLLLNFAKEIALQKEFDFMWLGVWDQNKAAMRFYIKNGFTIFGQHDFTLGTELQTDVMMKIKI